MTLYTNLTLTLISTILCQMTFRTSDILHFVVYICSLQEEMDMKVLQFKNKKLCERMEQRQAMEDELREKIEKLEKRQATDDTTLLIVNRYWSQVLLHI